MLNQRISIPFFIKKNNLNKPVDEIVPHVVPDPVVSQLHAVAMLRVQEVLVGVAPCVSPTPHIAAH
jgi:hypothetical protein